MGFAFIKHDTNLDFIGKRHWAYGISVLLILVGLASMFMGQGLKMGIDFAGGVIAQIQFEHPVKDEALKKSLDVPALPGISTQRFGDGDRDYLLRFSQSENANASQLRTALIDTLASAFPDNKAEIQRLEVVGPKVGADLTNKALAALYYSVLLIAVYISGRFEQRWMAGAIMAGALWGGRGGNPQGQGGLFPCLRVPAGRRAVCCSEVRACRPHRPRSGQSAVLSTGQQL